ncbi:hypothetical protein BaRGS_00031672 [Batillaria attramentaria]|uniref:C1q domain-containing protein n=1 Tax=Batillaria attramentaria TaxID=370345 RepID=A0ABD0JQC4_9CAEN
MDTRTFKSLSVTLLILVWMGHVTSGTSRDRRSDDTNPLEAVVSDMSQKVNLLTAKMAALETRAAASELAVAFTAVSSHGLVGLGQHQIVKFDGVIFNAGSGYNPTSGMFTAPSSGTYVFFVQVMRHLNDATVRLTIFKGGSPTVHAYACCSTFDTGSDLVTLHLNQGQTVHVQIEEGSSLQAGHSTFSGFKISPL